MLQTLQMKFSAYQEWQILNNPGLYPFKGHNMVFPAMGMAGEAGELLDKIKKHWRNESARTAGAFERNQEAAMSAASLKPEQRQAIIEEMGDVLWYIHAMCQELGSSLEEVAFVNMEKCKGRLKRGTTLGEGDVR